MGGRPSDEPLDCGGGHQRPAIGGPPTAAGRVGRDGDRNRGRRRRVLSDMLTIAPAMLVAALLALAGTLLVGLTGAVWSLARAPELATSPTLPAAGRRAPITLQSTAHVGIVLAWLFLIAALSVRSIAIGHAPWSNMYEFNQAFAAAILGAYLLLERRAAIQGLAPLAGAVSSALLVYTLTLPDTLRPLPPALQTPFFLTVHVGSAMLAYGIYAMAGVAAAAEIVQARFADRFGWLPPATACRAAAHRAVLLGLPVLTLAIVLGALWANVAWRSYWNNDPKELAAATTWFIYAAYLHLAGRRDRWGAAAPWLLLAGVGAILFTYFAANLVIPGQHSYSGL